MVLGKIIIKANLFRPIPQFHGPHKVFGTRREEEFKGETENTVGMLHELDCIDNLSFNLRGGRSDRLGCFEK